jgi:hypothetical protein
MHWIVNTSLKREGGYYALIEQLDHLGTPYTLVRKPPFVDYLISMEDDLDANGDHKPMRLDIEGPVFVTGTTSMKGVSDRHGWGTPGPGYIDAPSQQECLEHWGDHMLNAEARYGTLASIIPPEGSFFIRPDEDSKAFSGEVMDKDGFEDFRQRIIDIKGWTTCSPDTLVMVAPLKTIWSEYRCYVIDGKVRTSSRYKTGQTVAYSRDVGSFITDYANARVEEWNPRIAFVLDVAHTPDGLKVIETNAVSSSGFYDIDMNIFVGEINALEDITEAHPS